MKTRISEYNIEMFIRYGNGQLTESGKLIVKKYSQEIIRDFDKARRNLELQQLRLRYGKDKEFVFIADLGQSLEVETDKEHEKMGQAYGKRVDELKETVRRELDDVKNSQNRAHDALRDLSRDVNRFMRRQEARDKDR